MQTKKLYTRNTIARNIKHVGNGVLEIRRYQDGNLRTVAFWLFFICLFFFVKDMIVKKIQIGLINLLIFMPVIVT